MTVVAEAVALDQKTEMDGARIIAANVWGNFGGKSVLVCHPIRVPTIAATRKNYTIGRISFRNIEVGIDSGVLILWGIVGIYGNGSLLARDWNLGSNRHAG